MQCVFSSGFVQIETSKGFLNSRFVVEMIMRFFFIYFIFIYINVIRREK